MRVLFLTACINPKGMSFTKIVDVQYRRQQYLYAIHWYLKNTNFKILVVENTNEDMSSDFEKEIEAGRLELLSFDGNSYNINRGKGYGEALILEYGLNNSCLLRQADSFVKITGRLICKNINSLLNYCRDENTFYAYLRKGPRSDLFCDSRVFIAPINILNLFLSRKENLNDNNYYYFEHLLFDTRQLWIGKGYKYIEPWIPADIIGQSGSSGVFYPELSIKSRLKFYCKRFLHSLNYYC